MRNHAYVTILFRLLTYACLAHSLETACQDDATSLLQTRSSIVRHHHHAQSIDQLTLLHGVESSDSHDGRSQKLSLSTFNCGLFGASQDQIAVPVTYVAGGISLPSYTLRHKLDKGCFTLPRPLVNCKHQEALLDLIALPGCMLTVHHHPLCHGDFKAVLEGHGIHARAKSTSLFEVGWSKNEVGSVSCACSPEWGSFLGRSTRHVVAHVAARSASGEIQASDVASAATETSFSCGIFSGSLHGNSRLFSHHLNQGCLKLPQLHNATLSDVKMVALPGCSLSFHEQPECIGNHIEALRAHKEGAWLQATELSALTNGFSIAALRCSCRPWWEMVWQLPNEKIPAMRA
jgi:hypothetical protein